MVPEQEGTAPPSDMTGACLRMDQPTSGGFPSGLPDLAVPSRTDVRFRGQCFSGQ